jgi:hypothetical protein
VSSAAAAVHDWRSQRDGVHLGAEVRGDPPDVRHIAGEHDHRPINSLDDDSQVRIGDRHPQRPANSGRTVEGEPVGRRVLDT